MPLMPVSSAERAVARALASAFLAGEWTQEALVERGRLSTGARPRWVGPMARAVLGVYRDPPRDRPRELAAVLSGGPALRRAATALSAGVTRIVTEEGFTVNAGKTRVRGRSQRTSAPT